ncbi:ABC transporter G family member 2 [Penicillium rolfsii]|nr:ABC transporter G family member 2 [Penicillium rolfsii]
MAETSNSTCLSGGQPVPLGSGAPCPDGFYCPWADDSQPVLCPPSPDCLLKRLQNSANICIVSQGDFEPVISCEAESSGDRASLQQFDGVWPYSDNEFSLDLTFTGINLRLGRSPRDVLGNVHGNIRSGSVFGIMGASGSGKSSLAKILSGRSRPTEGCIVINGRPSQPENLCNMIGFIPQHDVVPPYLTVRENILYSGRVLLGNQMPAAEIESYVDSLISSLGLQHIRHNQVGSLLRQGGRGISGDEYKCVSIALALAGGPTALVLDEPTSGLDATAAHSLMKFLHGISRRGIIVICVI